MRVNVYVDGFNLYYRALKQPRAPDGISTYKWLDIGRLASSLLTTHTVHRIRYFTARVKARDGDTGSQLRQQAYLRALATVPGMSLHFGNFMSSKPWARLVTPLPDGTKSVKIHKTEEKGSDVNLASLLLLDGFRQDYEGAVVITNDSDLTEPIRLVRDELKMSVIVLDPSADRSSQSLAKAATTYRPIRPAAIVANQFPNSLTDANGVVTRPKEW